MSVMTISKLCNVNAATTGGGRRRPPPFKNKNDQIKYKLDLIKPKTPNTIGFLKRMDDIKRPNMGTTALDPLFGWFRLPRNVNCRMNKNKFITDFDNLFEHYKGKKFHTCKEVSVVCVEAMRGELQLKERHYGIAQSFSPQDERLSKFCVKNMSFGLITRLLYLIYVKGAEIYIDPTVNVDNLLKTMSHVIKKKDNSMEEEFEEEEDFEEMDLDDMGYLDDNIKEKGEYFEIVPFGKGNCTEKLLKAIKFQMKLFKGLFNYMYHHIINFKDVNEGFVEIKGTRDEEDNSMNYESSSGKLPPIKFCPLCSCPNAYTQIPRRMKTCHYSVKKYYPNNKTIDDKFETKVKDGEVMKEIPWRCGVCYTDLNLEIEEFRQANVIIDIIITESLYVLMGDLENLMKLGYTDTYDDLKNTDKENIRQHDKILVNEYFFHLQKRIVTVGQDLDPIINENVKKITKGVNFRYDSKFNSVKPEFVCELSVCREEIKSHLRSDAIACIGDLLPRTDDIKFHQWKYNDWLFEPNNFDGCCDVDCCNHNEKFVCFLGMGALTLSLPQILGIVNKQRQLYAVVPRFKDNKCLRDNTGTVITEGDNTMLFLDGCTNPLLMKTDTIETLCQFNTIVNKGVYYIINKVFDLELCSTICILGPYTDVNALPDEKIIKDDNIITTITLPHIDSLMGRIISVNFRPCTFNPHTSIFKYLCLRHLSGQVSHNTLKPYAVGFALRPIVVHNKVVSHPSVMFEMIDIPVLLSRICMMQLKMEYDLSIKYSDKTKYLGPLRWMPKEFEGLTTRYVINVIVEYLTDKFSVTEGDIMKVFESTHLAAFITKLHDNHLWTALLKLSKGITTERLNVRNLGDTDCEALSNNIHRCFHHNQDCIHDLHSTELVCKCCGVSIELGLLCKCCRGTTPITAFQIDQQIRKEVDDENEVYKHRFQELETKAKEIRSKIDHNELQWPALRPKPRTVKFQPASKPRIAKSLTSQAPTDKLQPTKNIEEIIEKKDKTLTTISNLSEFKALLDDNTRKIQIVDDYDTDANQEGVQVVHTEKGKQDVRTEEIKKEEQTVTTKTDDLQRETTDITIKKGAEDLDLAGEGWRQMFSKFAKNIVPSVRKRITRLSNDAHELLLADNKEKALTRLKYDFYSHVTDPVEFEAKLNDKHSTMYTMPHIAVGFVAWQQDEFEVVETISLPNSSFNSCGYEAFNYSLDKPIPWADFVSITGTDKNWSDLALMDLAADLGINIIMVEPRGTFVSKSNPDCDDFMCIHYDLPLPDESEKLIDTVSNRIGHFSPCIIRRIRRGGTYYVHDLNQNINDRNKIIQTRLGPHNNCNRAPDITGDENILCELIFNLHISEDLSDSISRFPTVYELDGKMYISNNPDTKLLKWETNLIHVEIRNEYHNLVDKIASALEGSLKLSELPEMRHKSSELPNEMESEIAEEIMEVLRTFSRINSMFNDKLNAALIKDSKDCRVIPWYGRSKIIFEKKFNHKLKKFDTLCLKQGKELYKCEVTNFSEGDPVVNLELYSEQRFKVMILKESSGSAIKSLVSLMADHVTMTEFKEILKRSSLTLGPAGYGKSTMISQEITSGDLCVAMTRSSVMSIEEKIKDKHVTVCSLEKASCSMMKCANTIFVDEATMVDWLRLALLCERPTTLKLYGSESQVGAVDMSPTPGMRHVMRIQDLLLDHQVNRFNTTTNRIGEELATFIRPMELKLVSLAKHKTTYNVTVLEDADFERLPIMVNRCNPDVIITPYNYNRQRIEAMHGISVPVVTTHSYQGQEVNKSLVILRADRTGKWDLNGNELYLNSALTRAKYHCEIIIYGYPISNIQTVSDLCHYVGGVQPDNTINEELEPENDDPEQDMNDELPTVLTIRTMHTLRKSDIDKLNELSITQQGHSVSYFYVQKNHISCVLKFMGKTVAEIVNIDGNVTITGPWYYKRKIMDKLDQKLDLNDISGITICPKGTKLVKIRTNQRFRNKVRELAWIVDKCHDGKLIIKINDVTITVTKHVGCPLFSGLKFRTENEYFEICQLKYFSLRRELVIHRSKNYRELSCIMKWLDIDFNSINYDDEVEIGWLTSLSGHNISSWRQYKERLSSVSMWFINACFDSTSVKCKELSDRNTTIFNRYMLTEKRDLIKFHQSPIKHDKLIYKTIERRALNLWKTENVYELFNKENLILTVKDSSDEILWRQFVRECLLDMDRSDLIKGTSGLNLEIPGLYLPLEKHYQLGTELRQIVGTNINKLLLLTSPGIHDSIRLNINDNDEFKTSILARYPKLTIQVGNYNLLNTGMVGVLEQIMLNTYAKTSKNNPQIVVYGGMSPSCVAVQGKYYVSLDIPDNNSSTKRYYDREMPIVNALVYRFNEGRDDEHKVSLNYDGSYARRYLLGVSLNHVTEEYIQQKLNNCDYLYGWSYRIDNQSSWYSLSTRGDKIYYHGEEYSNQIKNQLAIKIGNGTPLWVDYDKQEYVETTIVNELFGMYLVRFTKRKFPNSYKVTRVAFTEQGYNSTTNIEVPWINTQIVDIMRTRTFLTTKKLTINNNLLRNLLLRLITGDDSEDSLLAYARTVQSTQVITERSIQDLSTVDLHITMSTTWFALYVHHNYLYKLEHIISLINLGEDKEILFTLLQQIVPGIMKWVGIIAENTSEFIETCMKYLQFDRSFLTNLREVSEKIKNTNWAVQGSRGKIWNFSFKKLIDNDIATLDNGAPPDNDGDDKVDQSKSEDHVSDNESFTTCDSTNSELEHIDVSSESDTTEHHDTGNINDEPVIVNALAMPDTKNQNLNNKMDVDVKQNTTNLTSSEQTISQIENKNAVSTVDKDVLVPFKEIIKPITNLPTPTCIKGVCGEVPLIIWSYWQGSEINHFLTTCIRSWQEYNPEMRIVILTDANLGNMHNILNFDDMKQMSHQAKSDWLRCYCLANYGGIWLNLSSICAGSLTPLITATTNHESGLFQLGIPGGVNKMKYEMGVMISTTKNKILHEWFKLVNEFVILSNGDTTVMLDLIKDRFKTVAHTSILAVGDYGKFYLWVYVLQRIVLDFLKTEPCHINAENQKCLLYMGKYAIEPTKTWITLSTKSWQDLGITVPVVNLISSMRKNVIDNYSDKFEKGSVIAMLNNCGHLKYNPLSLSHLIPKELKITESKPSSHRMKKHNVDYILIAYGSFGDFIPILNIYKYLTGRGSNYVFMIHQDFANYINNDDFYDLRINTKETFKLAMDLSDKGWSSCLSGSINQLKEMMIAMNDMVYMYKNTQCTIVTTHSFYLYKNYSQVFGKEWIVLETFPLQMMSPVDRSRSWVEQFIGKFYDIDMPLPIPIGQGIPKNQRPVISMTNCLPWMVSNYKIKNPIGPLNLLSGYQKPLNIKIPMNSIFINFGSCTNQNDVEYMYKLAKDICTLGYDTILYDKLHESRVSNDILQIVNECPGRIILLKHFNCIEMQGKVFLTICHGGHGTVMDSLYSEMYIVIQPKIFDQFHWVKILEQFGIGCALKKDYNKEDLSSVITLAKANHNKLKDVKANVSINNVDLIRQLNPRKDLHGRIYPNALKQAGLIQSIEFINDRFSENLPIGYHILNDIVDVELFNPPTQSHCVRECINYAFSTNTKDAILACSSLSVSNLFKPGVTESELEDGLLSIGVNYCLVKRKNGRLMNARPGPVLCLKIGDGGISQHCILIKIINYGKSMSLSGTPAVISIKDNELENHITMRLANNTSLELCNPHIMMSQLPNKWIKNFMARTRSLSLHSLSTRQQLHVTITSMCKSGITYIGDTHHGDKSLGVGYCSCKEGWQLVNFEIFMNKLIVYTDIPCENPGVIINLHLDYPEERLHRTIVKDHERWVSLNKPTVNFNEINKPLIRSNELVSPHLSKFNLIVADFDNRTHHNGDDIGYLKRANKLIIYSEPAITLNDLLTTHNKPYNRLIIKMGHVKYCHEFNWSNSARLFLSLTNGIFEGNSIITDNRLSDDIKTYLIQYYKIIGLKVHAKLSVYENRPVIIAVSDLIGTLNQIPDVEPELISQLTELLKKEDTVKLTWLTHNNCKLKQRDCIIQISEDMISIPCCEMIIIKSLKGGADAENRIGWKLDSSNYSFKNEDKWNIKPALERKNIQSSCKDVIAMNTMVINNVAVSPVIRHITHYQNYEPSLDIYIAPYTMNYTASTIEPLYDMPDIASMQLWSDTDLTDWLNMYAPSNKTTIKSRELPGKIINMEKITMTKYPIKSRPVLTKICFEEGGSITGRLFSVVNLRTVTPDPEKILWDVCNAYFQPGWEHNIPHFKNDLLIITPEDVKNWVEENKDCFGVEKELNDLLAGELLIKPINDVNVHLKLESLLKEKHISLMKEQQARIIVWQRKAVCGLFAKLFVRCKERLKTLLLDHILYVDGLRPDEISAKLRQISNVFGFFENDLTKQDRQTDKPILEVEMLMYLMLGVHPNIIASWRASHEDWRFKSTNYWGKSTAMRLTGQATTALGNCITNMQVHSKFVIKNKYWLKFALFLGDDMCMGFSHKPNTQHLRQDIACKFNMQSKDSWVLNGATFCSMVVYKTNDDVVEIGPDVVRMKFRFEVTNGVHEATKENLLMRKASYLMMLGKTPEVDQLVKELQLPITPIHWYNYHMMLQGVADKWGMNVQQVEGYYHNLLHMISRENIYIHSFRGFGNR
ncbi:polyprotein [Oryza rufipogon endornavirus]|uniref:polyprotein n=1 Tax=Oryza rufipogon endornavirus TaxID=362692 RepID=UPI000066725D|nr:polyprotein [Oryza rufipogon alphaendornavirus]